MKSIFISVVLFVLNFAGFGQDKVTKCRYYSFTFGTIDLDSLKIKEQLTFKGEIMAYNSNKYSLIFFQKYTMRMELTGYDIPIVVDDTLLFDRTKNLMYLFKKDTAYFLKPWFATGILWKADTASITSEGKTAFLKKSLPANVFPMPRVAMNIGVYRYASRKFFLRLEEFESAPFNFTPYIERVKHFPIASYEPDIIF